MEFNFESAEDVTKKKRREDFDIKVFSNGRIRVSEEAWNKLKLHEDNNLLILKDKDGKLAISGVKGQGVSINDTRDFSNQSLSHLLGGKDSAWVMVGEGIPHPITEDIYYSLEKVCNKIDIVVEKEDVVLEEEKEVV